MLLRAFVASVVVLVSEPVASHHAITAVFEADRSVSVTGTLTKVDWINPHVAIFVDRHDGTGMVSWKFQGNPPAWWRNVGVNRASFAKGLGQQVVIEANPALDGSRYGYLRRIRFADGETLESLSRL